MGKEYHDSKKNHEGYADPTAYEAIRNVDKAQKRRGRPKKSLASRKDCGMYVRMNLDERDMVCQLAQKNGKSQADVVRTAISLYYSMSM